MRTVKAIPDPMSQIGQEWGKHMQNNVHAALSMLTSLDGRDAFVPPFMRMQGNLPRTNERLCGNPTLLASACIPNACLPPPFPCSCPLHPWNGSWRWWPVAKRPGFQSTLWQAKVSSCSFLPSFRQHRHFLATVHDCRSANSTVQAPLNRASRRRLLFRVLC